MVNDAWRASSVDSWSVRVRVSIRCPHSYRVRGGSILSRTGWRRKNCGKWFHDGHRQSNVPSRTARCAPADRHSVTKQFGPICTCSTWVVYARGRRGNEERQCVLLDNSLLLINRILLLVSLRANFLLSCLKSVSVIHKMFQRIYLSWTVTCTMLLYRVPWPEPEIPRAQLHVVGDAVVYVKDTNQQSLPTPFFILTHVCFSLYGPFNCTSSHTFSLQLSALITLFFPS